MIILERASSQRGSVILLVLILSGLVAGLASSFGSSARLQLGEGRDLSAGVHAELAAESGFEFALRQLQLDADWSGTGPDGIILPGGGSFVVDCQSLETGIEVRVDGTNGNGLVRYEVTVETEDEGSSTSNKAVICLGEEAEFERARINGDMLIADAFGTVQDWHNNADGSGWWGGDGREQGEFEFEFWCTRVSGILWKYTDTVYLGHCSDERITETPVRMPSWYLEDWLVPQPGVTILTDVLELNNQSFDDTVVLVYTQDPFPGGGEEDDIHFNNCHFNGGLIVYTPWDTDVRDPEESLGYEIEIEANNCHFGRPNHNNVGVIAPGAEVEFENCIIRGLVYANGVEMENSNLWGVLIGIHEIELERGQVFYDAIVSQNPPPGIGLDGQGAGLKLLTMRERFD